MAETLDRRMRLHQAIVSSMRYIIELHQGRSEENKQMIKTELGVSWGLFCQAVFGRDSIRLEDKEVASTLPVRMNMLQSNQGRLNLSLWILKILKEGNSTTNS